MPKYIRKNAHVEATQINTVEEARELAAKLEANRFGVEEISYPEEPDRIVTQIAIVRTKREVKDESIDLRFELGSWIVQGMNNVLTPYITAYRDYEFKKYFDVVEEAVTGPKNPSDILYFDGGKSKYYEDWFGQDFVGWANENVPGQVKDEVILQFVSDGITMNARKGVYIHRVDRGLYTIATND